MGKDIKVYLVDPEEGFERRRFGQADTIAGIIKINKESSKDIQFQTLLHEIIHFWDEDVGLDLNHDDELETEDKINRWATCIFMFLKENNVKINQLLKFDNLKGKTRNKNGERREASS